MTHSARAQHSQKVPTATWENMLSKALISKIFIDGQSLSIVTYEDSQTGDRSWGRSKLIKTANGFEAYYEQGFATYRIFLQYLPNETLLVTTVADYKDNAGPNVNRYSFIKAGEWGTTSSK
ncbi:MAG: hypothetical protein R3D00_04775 [Bacteroidia bacterium]